MSTRLNKELKVIPKRALNQIRKTTKEWSEGFVVKNQCYGMELEIKLIWASDVDFAVEIKKIKLIKPLSPREKILIGNIENYDLYNVDAKNIPIVKNYDKMLKRFCKKIDRYEAKYRFSFGHDVLDYLGL